MDSHSDFEKATLFNAFLIAIKRPDVFKQEREFAEVWLANTDNARYLRQFHGKITTLLYQETLPAEIYDILKEFHDDYVESLTEEELADYHERLSPRNILAVLA